MLSFACRFCATVTAILLTLSTPCWAQNSGPTSGEITVQLVQGLDSATNPKGMSQGVVTRSSNPAIPYRSTAMVGLGSDPINGGYTAKLVSLIINGRTVSAASSAVTLAPDLTSKLPPFMRQPNKNAVSGNHVFLPTQTFVKFTLAEPPPAPPPQVREVPSQAIAEVPKPSPQLSFVHWSEPLTAPVTKDVKAACEATDNTSQAYCYGVLLTFFDIEQLSEDDTTYVRPYCLPSGMTATQLRDAFLALTLKKPDQLEGPISIFYGYGMQDAFPCPKAPPKKHTVPRKKP